MCLHSRGSSTSSEDPSTDSPSETRSPDASIPPFDQIVGLTSGRQFQDGTGTTLVQPIMRARVRAPAKLTLDAVISTKSTRNVYLLERLDDLSLSTPPQRLLAFREQIIAISQPVYEETDLLIFSDDMITNPNSQIGASNSMFRLIGINTHDPVAPDTMFEVHKIWGVDASKGYIYDVVRKDYFYRPRHTYAAQLVRQGTFSKA